MKQNEHIHISCRIFYFDLFLLKLFELMTIYVGYTTIVSLGLHVDLIAKS